MSHRIILSVAVFLLAIFPFVSLHAQDAGSSAVATEVTATIGDLVKSEDSSAVYYWANDGERYAFPNENVYFSWYSDFDAVKEISSADLASIDFAGLVDYQAGTSLLKMPSVNTVYAVEPDGILRPIDSEEDAQALYGEDWASQVDDLSEAFFSQYQIGVAIDADTGELPQGYLMQDEDGDVCRVDASGTCVEIDDLISVELEALYERYAEDYDSVAERLEEAFGTEIIFENFDPSVLASILAELASSLDPVFVEESMQIAQEMYDLYALTAYSVDEDEADDDEDEDHDNMKDYWDVVYEQWLEEGDGDEEWFEVYYDAWTEEGYADYYNEYYDYFSESGEDAEYDYEDWSEYFGESSDWSYDEEGFYYTDEGGEEYYYDEDSDSSYTYDDSTETYYDSEGDAYYYGGESEDSEDDYFDEYDNSEGESDESYDADEDSFESEETYDSSESSSYY